MTSADTVPREADDRPGEPVPPPRRRPGWPGRRPGRLLVAVVALGFFFGPAAAGLLGVRAGQIENRRLAALPSPHSGWSFLPRLSGWAVDHLPLRDKAVRLNAEVSERVFDEPPASGGAAQVLQGRDGWLYLTADPAWACRPTKTVRQVVANANRLAAIVRRAGATFVLVVPPDKTTVETDRLPARYAHAGCSRRAKEQFWTAFRAAPPRGYADLYGPVQALKARDGTAYKPKDTHWAPRAAAEYARVVAERADPRLWATTSVVETGPVHETGDLSILLGVPADNSFPGAEVRRDGVSTPPYRGGKVGRMGVATFASTTTGAPLYTAPAAVFGDSFTGVSTPQLAPLFADLTSININTAPKDVTDTAKILVRSKLVIVESVERAFATGRAPLFDTATLDKLDRAVTAELAKR